MTPNERSSQKDDRKMGGNSGQKPGDTRSQQQQGKPATNKAPEDKSGAASSGRGNQRDQNRGSSPTKR